MRHCRVAAALFVATSPPGLYLLGSGSLCSGVLSAQDLKAFRKSGYCSIVWGMNECVNQWKAG